MVTPRIAGFRPGTSPPPVRMPITPFLVFTFAIVGSPSRGLGNRKLSTRAAVLQRKRRDFSAAEERKNQMHCIRKFYAKRQVGFPRPCAGFLLFQHPELHPDTRSRKPRLAKS